VRWGQSSPWARRGQPVDARERPPSRSERPALWVGTSRGQDAPRRGTPGAGPGRARQAPWSTPERGESPRGSARASSAHKTASASRCAGEAVCSWANRRSRLCFVIAIRVAEMSRESFLTAGGRGGGGPVNLVPSRTPQGEASAGEAHCLRAHMSRPPPGGYARAGTPCRGSLVPYGYFSAPGHERPWWFHPATCVRTGPTPRRVHPLRR
jgi:hypothetical protein